MNRSRNYTPWARPQGHRIDQGRLLFLRTLGPGGAGEQTGHCNVQMETGSSLEWSPGWEGKQRGLPGGGGFFELRGREWRRSADRPQYHISCFDRFWIPSLFPCSLQNRFVSPGNSFFGYLEQYCFHHSCICFFVYTCISFSFIHTQERNFMVLGNLHFNFTMKYKILFWIDCTNLHFHQQ